MAVCESTYDSSQKCFGACVQRFAWTVMHPILVTLGFILNSAALILLRRGTLQIVLPSYFQTNFFTCKRKQQSTYRRDSIFKILFYGPAYAFLDAITMNSIVLLLFYTPLFFSRCHSSSINCGWSTGLWGYLLAVACNYLPLYLANVLHSSNVLLVMFYGIQRCFATSSDLKLRRSFTLVRARYCIGLSLLVSLLGLNLLIFSPIS